MHYFELLTPKRNAQIFLFTIVFCLNGLYCTYSQPQPLSNNTYSSIRYEGHIYLQAEVSGKEGNFLLDTGADRLYLDSLFYSNHFWEFKNIAKAMLPGAGEKPKEIDFILDSVTLEFGDNHHETPGVPVLDLKSIVGDMADGIIGYGYFMDQILEVDYQNQKIRTYKDLANVDLTGFEKIAIQTLNNRMLIPMSIEITPELTIDGKFLLDLGTSRNVILTSICAKENQLSKIDLNKIKYYSSHAGVGGKSSGFDFRAPTIRLGATTIVDVVLDFSLDESGALASDQYDGLLGNGILERFRVVIDYEGKSIYLKPLEKISESFYASATGFSVADRSKSLDAWVITHMHEGAQAESAGLLIGDYITHVDDQPVASISYQERIAWHRTRKVIELTVKRKDKKPFRVSIALKPVI